MNFGYFFSGVVQTATGASGRVEIRPLTDLAAVDAGMKINIAVPLSTALAAASLDAIGAHCLQSAQQLLPESALSAWLKALQPSPVQQPTTPPDAADRWQQLMQQP